MFFHLGEPRPIELVNTRFERYGKALDGLIGTAGLEEWLTVNGFPSTVAGEPDALAAFHSLRDSLDKLFDACLHDCRPDPGTVEAVNEIARRAPLHLRLTWDHGPTAEPVIDASPLERALGEIVGEAITLLSGDDAELLRRCHGPRCVLLFIKNQPRRQWCTPECGNRARVARHYRRRQGRSA